MTARLKLVDPKGKPGTYWAALRVDGGAFKLFGPHLSIEQAESALIDGHMRGQGATEGLVVEIVSQFKQIAQVARIVRE